MVLSDKHFLLPVLSKSDFVFTKFKIPPNFITFLTYITDKYYLKHKKLYFLLLRVYLDALDGYIARKYDKASRLGNLLDHGNDAIFLSNLLKKIFGKENKLSKYFLHTIFYINFSKNNFFTEFRKNAGYGTLNHKDYDKGRFILSNILLHLLVKNKSKKLTKNNNKEYLLEDLIENTFES